MQNNVVQCRIMQYNVEQCSTMQNNAVQLIVTGIIFTDLNCIGYKYINSFLDKRTTRLSLLDIYQEERKKEETLSTRLSLFNIYLKDSIIFPKDCYSRTQTLRKEIHLFQKCQIQTIERDRYVKFQNDGIIQGTDISLVQAFHNIFVDKYCLMYTEETAMKKQQVFEKDVIFRTNGTTERRKYCEIEIFSQCNVRCQVVLKQKFQKKYFKHCKINKKNTRT